MAKAKKTTTDAPAAETKKPKGKAKAAAKPVAATPPMVDTTLAAAAAAKGLVAGLSATGPAVGGAGKSSASFEKMKESLGKSAGGLGAALDKSAPSGLKKPPRGFGTNSPTIGGGRNQTFGADVSRASVPRRTGGG